MNTSIEYGLTAIALIIIVLFNLFDIVLDIRL